jgi:hypothetical protein
MGEYRNSHIARKMNNNLQLLDEVNSNSLLLLRRVNELPVLWRINISFLQLGEVDSIS